MTPEDPRNASSGHPFAAIASALDRCRAMRQIFCDPLVEAGFWLH